jgi:surface polysaccharide O-acyltransferase-like enzyme
MANPPLPENSSRQAIRLPGVDVLRILAALCVVILHAKPFASVIYSATIYATLRDGLVLFSRFAVPFFFIAAGYFMSRKLAASDNPLRAITPYAYRLSLLYLLWTGFYFFFPINWLSLVLDLNFKPIYWEMTHAIMNLFENPLIFLFKSTSAHLWFLPALTIAACMLALAMKHGKESWFVVYGGLMYSAGMLADAYAKTPAGLDINNALVLGLFYPPLFVGIGWMFTKFNSHPLRYAMALIVAGLLIQLCEAFFLQRIYNTEPVVLGYLAGTVPLSVGMMMAGLSLPASRITSRLGGLAGFALGIYLLHIWVKGLLLPLDSFVGGPVWELGFVLLIFSVSAIFVALLKRTHLGRVVV